MTHLWQRDEWPGLHFDRTALVAVQLELAAALGSIRSKLAAAGPEEQRTLAVSTLRDDALATARIEDEALPAMAVQSTAARLVGTSTGQMDPSPRDVDGLLEMLDDATRRANEPLTDERLFGWHAALFPSGFSRLRRIATGSFRQGAPAAHPSGRGQVEAPAHAQIPAEMATFLRWWQKASMNDCALKAGIAHLWFTALHPFDGGNGHLSRALVDMALAAGDAPPVRYFSVSAELDRCRDDYDQAITEALGGELDITAWLDWFLRCVLRAVQAADPELDAAIARQALRAKLAGAGVGQRQLKALHQLIGHEPDGSAAGLTNAKYRTITGASKATASRDLADLVSRGWLAVGKEGGRSARYRLAP